MNVASRMVDVNKTVSTLYHHLNALATMAIDYRMSNFVQVQLLVILLILWQVDVNECNEGTSGCSQICNDTDGSYLCSCRSGYQLDTNNHTCNDINECTVNYGGCQEMCQNTNGSYGCLCPAGYSLDNNNINCTGIVVQTTCYCNKFQQILMSVVSIMVAVAKFVLILLVLTPAPVVLVTI